MLPLPGGRIGVVWTLPAERANEAAAESDRLLYVAATRAREKLIFSGCITISASGKTPRLSGWLDRIGSSAALGLAGLQIDIDDAELEPRDHSLTIGDSVVSCRVFVSEWAPPEKDGERSVTGARPFSGCTIPPPLLAPWSGHHRPAPLR